MPSGWSAVLPATSRYESSAARHVILKTRNHHYGESYRKGCCSYLFIYFYSMETEISTEGKAERRIDEEVNNRR